MEMDLDRWYEERVMGLIIDMTPERYDRLTHDLLERLGLELTASASTDGVVMVEAKGKDGLYLVRSTREPIHITMDAVGALERMAAKVDRLPVLMTPLVLDEATKAHLEAGGTAYADREKMLALIRSLGMGRTLLDELDQELLVKEGNRFLPSAGSFDELDFNAREAMGSGLYREALGWTDRALQLKPDHDRTHQLRARILMAMGIDEAALDAIKSAIHIDPLEHRHWYIKGLILHRLGRLDEEVEAYDIILRDRPDHAGALLNKGATLYEMRRFPEALATYDVLLSRQPKNPQAMNNKGLVLKAMDDKAAALNLFDQAIIFDPGHRDARINRALTLAEIDRLDEAELAWKEIISTDRTTGAYWFQLGEVQQAMGHDVDSLSSYSVALELDPTLKVTGTVEPPGRSGTEADYWNMATRCAALESVGRLEEALEAAEECLRLDWGQAFGHVRKANICRRLGRTQEALAAVRDGAQADPGLTMELESVAYSMGRYSQAMAMLECNADDPNMRLRQMLLHLRMGEIDQAIRLGRISKSARMQQALSLAFIRSGGHEDALKLIDRLLRSRSNSPELLNARAVCLNFMGAIDDARMELHRAIDICPTYSDAWNNLGCIHFALDDLDEAEGCFARSLLMEESPSTLMNIGLVHFMRDDASEALKTFTRALELEPSAEALNLIGIIAVREGDMVRALELFDAALDRSPDFAGALENKHAIENEMRWVS